MFPPLRQGEGEGVVVFVAQIEGVVVGVMRLAATLRVSQWNAGYFQPKGEEFSGTPGIQVTVNGTTPLDYFKLFFTDNILDLLVTETNRYAAQCIVAAPKPLPKYSYLALWVPVTRTDMAVFIALLINMGNVNKPEVRSYWSVDPILATSFFGTCMSRNRFEQILMFLHICNNLEQPDVNDPHRDKLFKICPFLDMFTEACKIVFYPKRDLAVDESMMPWKGRVAFKQFIPSKPTKYGIKMYFCCEAGTGYISCLKMYSGKQGEHAEREHSENVVRYLTSDFHGKGHTIFMDSFFSSLKLFEELKQKGTGAVGTLHANRRGIPLSLKQARMKKGEAQSLHETAPSEKKSDASLLCMKFKDKKDVFLLSTKHNGEFVDTEKINKQTNQPLRKPQVVLDYNDCMNAVDQFDQNMAYYCFNWKTVKWWKRALTHLIHVSKVQSMIVFNMGNHLKNK